MAKATEPDSLPDALVAELCSLRGLVGLAAFAVEARRVLSEIDMVADTRPCVEEGLKAVDSRRQWHLCPDTAGVVLLDVYGRLGALLDGAP